MNPAIIGLAACGWFATTWMAYRWGLSAQIAAKILEIKTAMLPVIEKFVVQANGDEWHGLRPNSIGQLFDPVMKLKSLVTGRKRKLLVAAWEIFAQTTPAEMHVPEHDETPAKTQKMRQTFLARLQKLQEIIEDC